MEPGSRFESLEDPMIEKVDVAQEKADISSLYNQIMRSHGRGLSEAMFEVGKSHIDPKIGDSYPPVSSEVGCRFNAHGIARSNQLEKLFGLLDNGIDKTRDLYTAPFEVPAGDMRGAGAGFGTSGGTAYKEGLAVVTSGYGDNLQEKGIKHVFINDVFSKLVEPLQKLYPDMQIHLLSEQKVVMEQEAESNKDKVFDDQAQPLEVDEGLPDRLQKMLEGMRPTPEEMEKLLARAQEVRSAAQTELERHEALVEEYYDLLEKFPRDYNPGYNLVESVDVGFLRDQTSFLDTYVSENNDVSILPLIGRNGLPISIDVVKRISDELGDLNQKLRDKLELSKLREET